MKVEEIKELKDEFDSIIKDFGKNLNHYNENLPSVDARGTVHINNKEIDTYNALKLFHSIMQDMQNTYLSTLSLHQKLFIRMYGSAENHG